METVIITGVGRGIGESLMHKFLKENFFVIGTYKSERPKVENKKLKLIQLDLTDQASRGACFDEIRLLKKPIDIIVNNAGVLLDEDETSVVEEKLRATLEVNLIGTISFTENILPLIPKGGHIVSISSSAGSLGLPVAHDHYPHHYPAYKISKTALNMYTKTLAGRLQGQITVSSVHPGWVKTDMGGDDAEMEPEEAANYIYKLAISRPETGQFWFKGEKFPW